VSTLFPHTDPQSWQIAIGSFFVDMKVMKALVKGLKSSIKLDKKGAVGRDGATLTYQGDNLAEWTIELTAWNATGWAILEALVIMARTQKGGAFQVYHPLLAPIGITQMVVESVDGPEFDGNLMSAVLGCVQWAKPAKKTVTATSKAASLNVPIPGTAYNPPAEPARPASPAATKPKP
jgi:hypothetical protein